MKFSDYRRFDAVGLAELVSRKETSPAELLQAALSRAAQVQPQLNPIVLDMSEQGRAAAAGPIKGPLAGVPFLIKDVSMPVAGAVTGSGSDLMANTPPAAEDGALVKAYRQAGLVIFGKSATPEFGLAATTEPRASGVVRNPWNPALSPGGSSGGASCAVASGILPAAHGSDGGGSIRIPASACGLFGMKPSRGRVSLAPAGEGWGGLSVHHALTRSVRDSALLLDISCQPQPGDPYWLEPPQVPFLDAVQRPPGKLRIAFTTDALITGSLHADCIEAVRDAAQLCESLGHSVEEARPNVDFLAMAVAANVLVSAGTAATVAIEAERRGRPVERDEVEAVTWAVLEAARGFSATDAARASRTLHSLSRQLAGFFETYDVLITSTLGRPPVPLGEIATNGEIDGYAERLYSFIPNTQPFNISGQPAMSVPLFWNAEGLPIGVQFAAKGGAEALLFQLAGQLEAARPWFDRVAPDLSQN